MNRKKYDEKSILEIAIPLKCEGYTYREIAKIINVPKSTIHRYLMASEKIVKGVADSWQASMR